MDTLSHALWAMAVFWHTPYRYWAFLFGALPDLLTFGPRFAARFIDFLLPLDIPRVGQFVPYTVSHSFITWIMVGAIVYAATRKRPYVLLACGIHITQDMFTHVGNWLTPVLWPLSDWGYQYGIRWREPVFMAVNIIALAIVYGLIAMHTWQHRKKGATKYKKPLRFW